jgi:hypothetical protein
MQADLEFLTQQLLAEHSKPQTMRLVRWVGQDADRVALLLEVFLGDEYRLTQRSAWVVRYVAERVPYLMQPHLERLVAAMRNPTAHDAVRRNVLNVFEHIPIPESLYDDLADICFEGLANPQQPIAVRCAAITILDVICHKIPELRPEFMDLLQLHYEHGSAGFKSRAGKVLFPKKQKPTI